MLPRRVAGDSGQRVRAVELARGVPARVGRRVSSAPRFCAVELELDAGYALSAAFALTAVTPGPVTAPAGA